jgi:hypothetical protein
MTSRHMQFGIALAVCSCLFLPACHQEGGGGGKGQNPPLDISLSIAAAPDNTCQQKDPAGNTGNIYVLGGQNVTYQGGAAVLSQFKVVFPSAIPFSSAVIDSPNGAATNAGAANGTPGTTYSYSSLTINNRACSNPGSLGLIMR